VSVPGEPDQGHLVWLCFDPHAGHEQGGWRPGLVLSPAAYNRATGLALVCPITTQVKRYPFEVHLPDGLPVSGVILVDHLKNIDWQARKAEYRGTVPDAVLEDVMAKLRTILPA
jgi:mRNA interferase MazF